MEKSSSQTALKNNNYSFTNILKFLVPSVIGMFLFMMPIKTENGITVPIAILSSTLKDALSSSIPFIVFLLISFTLISTIITKVFKPGFIIKNTFLNSLFNVSPIWVIVRTLAGIFTLCVFFNINIPVISSESTGGLIFTDLLPILFCVFFFAGLTLPLLLNFGLLEFVGALLVKVMRPLFNLPGRSSVDCLASWLGDGTIGVVLTSKQYEDGFYTQREASVIGTCFSLVSITFTLVIIGEVGLSHMFVPFYLTVTIASIACALILPRIYPLRKKKDVLITGEKRIVSEEVPKGYNSFTHGMEKALNKSEGQNIFESIFVSGVKNVLDMWLCVLPIVMAIGTLGLIVAEFTPIFKILGLPFLPLLYLLQIPEAVAASQTLMAGFADMLLPSILSSNITSELTRFVVACVSVTQLIYLSEVGSVLLASKIPLNFKEMFIIFLERTLITLPIIAVIAHIIFR